MVMHRMYVSKYDVVPGSFVKLKENTQIVDK